MKYTDPNDVSATCLAAADYLGRYGLHRLSFWSGIEFRHGSPVCLWGAICAATGLTSLADGEGIDIVMDDRKCPASRAVQDEIWARCGTNVSIPAYSDDHAINLDEVINLLIDVAAKHQPDEYRSGAPS